ncbi:MAG: PQQ-binding-like beta-propeller repeat protein [Verrucomicrobia bacterium]|nr:PQQ-binding-like beta-propeller repeat protein [Verrucomicrobiota bacterium]
MTNKIFLGIVATALTIHLASGGDEWPQFRGPTGDGHSDSKNLPTSWSETKNIKWKTAIHGRAWSSPVVLGKQVWVTTATEDGRELFAVCVDRDSGKIIHDLKLFEVEKPQFAHKFNTYASPTPVIEPGRVYVTFGSPGTACLDTASGKVLWERRDFVCNHYRGAGSSPILFGNLLIMNFDGSDHQFIVALDKATGKTVWQVNRSLDYKDLGPDGKPESEGDWRKAFATAHVATFDGKPVLLSQGAKAFYAYEPATGAELWRVEERTSHSAGTRPVVGEGLIFVPSGWSTGQLLALQPGKKGEVLDVNAPADASATGQLRVAWKSKRNVPRKPSLTLVGDLLFMIDDGGIASCVEAKTGAEVWRERINGNYSASPLFADSRVYFFSEEGKATVVAVSREFKVIAENSFDDGFMASPAAAGKALFLRTKTALYRVEQ